MKSAMENLWCTSWKGDRNSGRNVWSAYTNTNKWYSAILQSTTIEYVTKNTSIGIEKTSFWIQSKKHNVLKLCRGFVYNKLAIHQFAMLSLQSNRTTAPAKLLAMPIFVKLVCKGCLYASTRNIIYIVNSFLKWI